MDDLAPVLGVIGVFGFITWFLRFVITAFREHKVARMQADLQNRLLEKFNTTDELVTYLTSGAGEKLVQPLRLREEEPRSPYGRILGAVQVGVILICGGVACLFLDGRLPFDEERGFLLLGTVGTALGAGFLISGAVAYVLSRSWGLLDGREA